LTVPLLDLPAEYASIRDEVDSAMARVVEKQHFVLGPEVEALEAELADYLGVRHAIGCASGTDALLLPLKAIGAVPGDEIIVPGFTFFATAGAVWNAGFRPVFCDVDAETFNVTRASVEAVWTDRTRGFIPVHLFGQPAPMEDLLALARERGAWVMEDAAQSIGSHRMLPDGETRSSGTMGDCGAYSFFPTKNLGAFGDGGLIVTDDDAFAEKLFKLRVHGGQQMYHHQYVGTNSRLDALQAAVLRAKLPHLDAWTRQRQANGALYDAQLDGVPGVSPPFRDPGSDHVFNQYTIRTTRRDELRAALAEKGIGSGVYYPVALHLQACFSELGGRAGDLPVAEAACQEVLSLPIFPSVGEDRIRRVTDAIRAFQNE